MPVDPVEPADTGLPADDVEPVEAPPRRLGGKPKAPPPTARVDVHVGALDLPYAEVLCEHIETRSILIDGEMGFTVPVGWDTHECTVRLPTEPPQEAPVELRRGSRSLCTMEDHGLVCR
jgi:hypothetical protein